jgi:hypothetical protein
MILTGAAFILAAGAALAALILLSLRTLLSLFALLSLLLPGLLTRFRLILAARLILLARLIGILIGHAEVPLRWGIQPTTMLSASARNGLSIYFWSCMERDRGSPRE